MTRNILGVLVLLGSTMVLAAAPQPQVTSLCGGWSPWIH
jgi:hypothetical protein